MTTPVADRNRGRREAVVGPGSDLEGSTLEARLDGRQVSDGIGIGIGIARPPTRQAAVVVLPGPAPLAKGDRPPAIAFDRSHFGGPQVGVLAGGIAY